MSDHDRDTCACLTCHPGVWSPAGNEWRPRPKVEAPDEEGGE